MTTLHFVYDVVCPYAYLASRVIEAETARAGLELRWQPVLLGGVLAEIGAPVDPNVAMPPAKAAWATRDIVRCAALDGAPLRIPAAHPRRTVAAMRLCTAAPVPVRAAVSKALFAAYWEHGQDVSDPAVLATIAGAHGIRPAAITAPQTKAALREATAAAVARGVFGVPTFCNAERLWWGRDRLDLAIAATAGRAAPPVEKSVGKSVDKPEARRAGAAPRRVVFVHDFASPFSYLAACAIDRVVGRYGVQVEHKPILLGALFRSIGTPDVPLFTMSAPKQAYVRQDLCDWAAARGDAFRFPTHFPMRSVLPLRVALAEPRATMPLYRAAWADDLRIDTPEAVAPVLRAAGLDPQRVLERAATPAIKAALRHNTDEAQAQGMCGVPTFVLSDPERPQPLVLWGQDRLAMLEAALDGWWPTAD